MGAEHGAGELRPQHTGRERKEKRERERARDTRGQDSEELPWSDLGPCGKERVHPSCHFSHMQAVGEQPSLKEGRAQCNTGEEDKRRQERTRERHRV